MKPGQLSLCASIAALLAAPTAILADDDDEFVSILSVILPPDVTEMTISAEFLKQSDTFRYEVLAREESWNQTAIESCFLLEDDG